MELSKETRAEAVASLRRYMEESGAEPMGELAAGLLLDFFLEEIGPAVYNGAVADAQKRVEERVGDLAGELWKPEFGYWGRVDAKRRGKR
jgi:uncharacterized protein (DUF2164 family)